MCGIKGQEKRLAMAIMLHGVAFNWFMKNREGVAHSEKRRTGYSAGIITMTNITITRSLERYDPNEVHV